MRFLGDEGAYWRLRIKGAALVVVTLGIYRFWLATDVRRFLWSNTEISGDTLEYNGLATELLVGFLFAVAILVPLYMVFALVALELDMVAVTPALIGFALLLLLGEYALYRARRYRLTRTVFRGLRFDQHGSPWRYALYALRLLGHRHRHARARLSVDVGLHRALQDAQHQLWRSAGPLRGQGAGVVPARPADLALGGRGPSSPSWCWRG